MKFAIGLIISFAVGVGCRYFDVPVGSPAAIPGALIVLAMTTGYAWTNQVLNARKRMATTAHLCGGPTGRPVAKDNAGSPKVSLLEE
jgi:XapX domain-containing protein